MYRHSLGVVESVSAVVFFCIAKIFLAFPRMVTRFGGSAAWMIVVVAAATALPIIWSLLGLQKRFPGKSLTEVTEQVWGPAFGVLINLGYFLIFFGIGFLSLRQFSENIVATILPKTPLPVIIGLFLSLITYGVMLGPEGITRVCWMVAPFTAVSFLGLMIGGFMTYHTVRALTPVWGYGLLPTAGNGVVYSSIFAEWLVLGLLAPHFRKPEQFRQTVRWSVGLSVATMVGTIILYEMIFPWPSGTRVSFPLLELSRLIITGRWVQRLESLFFLVWVIVATLKSALSLYASARVLSDTMRLPNYRHVVMPLALLSFSMSQLPSNMTTAVEWDFEVFRIWASLLAIIPPVLTWILSAVRRSRKERV